MATVTYAPKRFLSRPNKPRLGPPPIATALILGWIIVGLGFLDGWLSLQEQFGYAPVILAVSAVLFLFMIGATYRWAQGSKRHELFIEPDRITLSSVSNHHSETVRLSEVKSAHYFPAFEASSLNLSTDNDTLRIPLWAFGDAAEKELLAILESAGIRVISTPSDLVL